MATIGDGFKDIFLAGIGAMAITAEKSKDLVDQLISKGELTVDQGKQINTELKHKAEDVASTLRYAALAARMATMPPEERAAFAATAALQPRPRWATPLLWRRRPRSRPRWRSPSRAALLRLPRRPARSRGPARVRERRPPMAMADNTLLKYFFSSGAEIDPEGRFNLSRKTRTRRLKEIYSILQKHHFLRGFSPEEFRAMLEDLGPSFVKIGQTLSTRS